MQSGNQLAFGGSLIHKAFVASLVLMCFALDSRGQDPPTRDIFPVTLRPKSSRGFRITAGTEADAIKYYDELGASLNFADHKVPADLGGLLAYLGYEALLAEDINHLPSRVLMDYAALREHYQGKGEFSATEVPQDWSIVAAGYFAPKTSDVSGLSNKISWRKVVRLKPRPGANAVKDSVDAMYFLSVIYVTAEELAARNPFDMPSANVQIMVTRNPKDLQVKLRDSALWFAFDPTHGYVRSYSTTTSWDAADPALVEKKGLQPYYVPDACVQCHGNSRATGTPHFFDTDYAIDKAMPGEFFADTVGRSGHSPLFESGLNPNTEKYYDAMQAFRTLNVEILRHNREVDQASVQTRGAENWQRLHGQNGTVMHRRPIERGWQGDDEWDEGRRVDRQLLPLLNNYCYRCHGTVYYNVYDRAAVKKRVGDMLQFLDTGYMPMDRELSEDEKGSIRSALKLLEEETKDAGVP